MTFSCYSNVLPKSANLQTRLTRDITLNLPVISAAMDTVTESTMAITMAQPAGLVSCIKTGHRQTSRQVRRVKKFEAGMC